MANLPFQTLMISPVGEPGCGKSTFSLWLCSELKQRGISAEFVPEVIKYDIYDPERRARAISGKVDGRILRLQHRLTKPLLGQVEVIVNDGALEPFYFYAAQRMTPVRLAAFREQLEGYRREQGVVEQRFVAPVRDHAYEQVGRQQAEHEADEARRHLLKLLSDEFAIRPAPLYGPQDRTALLEVVTAAVLARRHRAFRLR